MDTGGCQNVLVDYGNQQFSKSKFHGARKPWAAKKKKMTLGIASCDKCN